jgi:hypothetical protein
VRKQLKSMGRQGRSAFGLAPAVMAPMPLPGLALPLLQGRAE